MKIILKVIIFCMLFCGFSNLTKAQEMENPQEELVNNQWYLTKLVIEDEEFPFISDEDLSEIILSIGNDPVMDDGIPSYMVESTACEAGVGTIWILDNNTFELDGFYFMTMDDYWYCEMDENGDYSNLYFDLWNEINDPIYPIIHFSIIEVDDYKQLILTKENGNQFYYQNVPYMSINDQQKSNLTLYPNPANDFLYIENLINPVQIEIYDLSGKVLLSREINEATKQLNVSQLSEGMYLYQLNQNGQGVKTGKLVKN